MEHVTFDEFFDFVKNEDADWYIPGLKEYFEGLNQDEIYIQDNFLGKLIFQFNKFENNLKKAVFDKFICYKKMMDEKEKSKLKNSANEIANVDLESAYSYNELFDNVSHNKLLEDINKYNNCGDVDSDFGIKLRFNEIHEEETFNQGSLDIIGSVSFNSYKSGKVFDFPFTMTIGLDSDSYFEKEEDIYKIYKFREFYAFSKTYGTEDTIHYRYRKNDFPLEKYGTYGVHVDSDIPFASDKYSIYTFRNDYAPFKYAFQYDCLTHLVKSELGKELLENGAKEDLLRILYNRIAYAVDESLMPEYD